MPITRIYPTGFTFPEAILGLNNGKSGHGDSKEESLNAS